MYSKHYPNIELLVYQTRLLLLKEDKDKYNNLNLNVDIFPQTWGSTALGFGGIGGQAITTAYTTIVYDVSKKVYVIFFDNKFAYMVESPNDKFIKDMYNRQMLSVDKALKEY